MKNIPGWFPKTNQETLEMLIKKHNVKTVLEIGTFVGLSAVWFAERVERVYTVDPFDAITRIDYLRDEWKQAAKNQFERFIENTKQFGNIVSIVNTSEGAYETMDKEKMFDLIYIDGSHEYEDVKKDIEIWAPHAKLVICGDDYTESWPGVKQAVDECGLNVNKNQRCWFVEKV